MPTFDATPPADYPVQVIVSQDEAFTKRNPDAAYWLRIKRDGGNVDAVLLQGAIGTGHARKMAQAQGYNPTHYTFPGDATPFLYPSGPGNVL